MHLLVRTLPVLLVSVSGLLAQAPTGASLLSDLALTADGSTLYLADPGRGLILRAAVAAGGHVGPFEVVLEVGSRSQVVWPGRIALDAEGQTLFVSDPRSHRVGRLDLQTGAWTTLAGTGRPGPASDGLAVESALSHPGGMACCDARRLLVADTGNREVRIIDLVDGTISTIAGGPGVRMLPLDVAVGDGGQVFVLDGTGFRVMLRTPGDDDEWAEVEGSGCDRAAARQAFALDHERLLLAEGPYGGYAELPIRGGAPQHRHRADEAGWCSAVAAAPDGAVWFVDAARGSVLRTDGDRLDVVATMPRPSSQPELRTLRHEPDPSIVTDAEVRAAITAVGRPWWVRDDRSGVEFVLVPPGRFAMGIPAAHDARGDASPPREVRVERALYVGRTEITNDQYRQLDPLHATLLSPHHRPSPDGLALESLDAGRQPAAGLCWFDAHDYVRRFGYRLPTEVEWEYAARGGSAALYPWGDELADGLAHANLAGAGLTAWIDREIQTVPYDDGFLLAAPVGSFAPNGFGLHDCIGNVWEWCGDWYRDGSREAGGGPEPSRRVLRGSSWQNPFVGAPLAGFRGQTRPDAHHVLARGFRVVLELP